jgi:hypothetical protein
VEGRRKAGVADGVRLNQFALARDIAAADKPGDDADVVGNP